jgi:hypothetical protein
MANVVQIQVSEQHRIAQRVNANIREGDARLIEAGRDLAILKQGMPAGITWQSFLQDLGIDVGRRRADELIRWAADAAAAARVRDKKAENAAKSRAESAPRGAEPTVDSIKESGAADDGLDVPASLRRQPQQGNGSDPTASAELMKVRFAALDQPEVTHASVTIAPSGTQKSPITVRPVTANPLTIEWAKANPKQRAEFVRERWSEITEARTGISAAELHGNGGAAPDEDRWIEGDYE